MALPPHHEILRFINCVEFSNASLTAAIRLFSFYLFNLRTFRALVSKALTFRQFVN
jgi:hypothetical protein